MKKEELRNQLLIETTERKSFNIKGKWNGRRKKICLEVSREDNSIMVAYSSVIGNKILEHLLYAKLTIFSEQCRRLGLVFGSYLCDNVS